jgi:hypothetical protein
MTLLLDAGVYESANALRTPRSGQLLKDLEEATATSDAGRAELVEIASQWGGRAERRFLTASQIPVPRDIALAALEELCLMGWAERGLQASCDACGITSFHPAAQTSHQPACPACSAPVRYTQDTGNLSTHYRLDGLVDRAADHGVPAHLLVIAALTRENPLSHFLPGTQLPFTTDDDPEVDIFGVWDGIVLAGEVKNSSADFTTVQLKRDVALSKRLGADVHLLAAVDTVDPETVEQAQTLCVEAGLQLEVWDKTRLRPATTETKAVDTATDTFERVRRALAALTGEVDKNPTRAARKSGFFLRTAMEPRSPSAGQVEALTAVINQYGAELAAPVAALDQALSELLAACDKPGAV